MSNFKKSNAYFVRADNAFTQGSLKQSDLEKENYKTGILLNNMDNYLQLLQGVGNLALMLEFLCYNSLNMFIVQSKYSCVSTITTIFETVIDLDERIHGKVGV